MVKRDITVLFVAFPFISDRHQKILDEKCNLNLKDVRTIQLRTLDDHIAIMFSSALIAARFMEQNKSQIFTTSDGIVSPIPCWIDEEYTTVRVHDLPPEIPHKGIWMDMAKYGNITQIYNEYLRTLLKVRFEL